MLKYSLGQSVVCRVNPDGGPHCLRYALQKHDEYVFMIIASREDAKGGYPYLLFVPSVSDQNHIGTDLFDKDFPESMFNWLEGWPNNGGRYVGCDEQNIISTLKSKCEICKNLS